MRVSAVDGVDLVGEAEDGAEAVELAVSLRADAVLLDCLMPEMDGFEAARAIREALPEVALFLHSGEQPRRTRTARARSGCRSTTSSDSMRRWRSSQP